MYQDVWMIIIVTQLIVTATCLMHEDLGVLLQSMEFQSPSFSVLPSLLPLACIGLANKFVWVFL